MRQWNLRTLRNEAQGGKGSDLSFDKDIENNVTRASLYDSGGNSLFEVGIVEEVVSNPYDYFTRETPYNLNGSAILLGDILSGRVTSDDDGNTLTTPYKNPAVVDYAPANSVVVFLNNQKKGGSGARSILCFPFFSSHLMLPVKPGENVWVMKFSNNIYYWFCRQPSFRQIEDVNFTFAQRENNVSNVKSSEDPNTYVHFKRSDNGLPENLLQNISNSAALNEEFTGEPVPRQVKDCGDFLIQGSNNSHIYLGKEKFEEENTILPEVFTPNTIEEDKINALRKPVSPAIDLCVLRKKNDILELANDRGDGSEEIQSDNMSIFSGEKSSNPDASYYENQKSRELLKSDNDIFPEEFYDSDIYDCAARIYMSNAKSIDEILFANDYAGENSASPQDLEGLGNYGTIAALGTNARLVGTETIKIHNVAGSSGIQFTPSGDVIVFANTEGGAKIVLESGGDIRIVPGENGILKLGSDNATGGIVAASASTRVEGSVTATPIVTTAGGIVSAPAVPSTGLYSNKVLIAVSGN